MYHEIGQPFGLLYNLAAAMKPGGRVGIVDADAIPSRHGTPPALLRCELSAVGYREVGFTARNNGGSAVLFESIHGGKIVFHKPHPIAKIDSVMLKSMGKRMAKWFGWGRERFALADGGTSKLPKEAHPDNK